MREICYAHIDINTFIERYNTLQNDCFIKKTCDDIADLLFHNHRISICYLHKYNKAISISVPSLANYSYLVCIEYPKMLSGNAIIKRIKQELCCYSDGEIAAIKSDMPLLFKYTRSKKGSLSDTSIIFRDHFLEDNLGLIIAFLELGVTPECLMVLDKGDETIHRLDIYSTFEHLGVNVGVLDNAKTEDTSYMIEWKQRIFSFLENCKSKNVIIIDDGAIVTHIIPSDIQQKIKAVVELTEMGLRRLRKTAIACPIFDIAKSDIKRELIYPEIANSIFLRILELLKNEKLSGRHILICGYGDMGSLLCQRFKDYGLLVSVYDIDIFALIKAAENGLTPYTDLSEAIKSEKPFIVIGASGERSITETAIQYMQNNTYVTTGATADLSCFTKSGLAVLIEEIEDYGIRYTINGNDVTLLGNGRSINLFRSEAMPTRVCDLFRTAIAITAVNIAGESKTFCSGINQDDVNRWINESGILNDYYSLYFSR